MQTTPTPTPTLGASGASAITRSGAGPSNAIGNVDTRANASNKSDIEPTSVDFQPPSNDAYNSALHGDDADLFQRACEAGFRPAQFSPEITPAIFMQARAAGYDHDTHVFMGGPAVFLQASQAGYNPTIHDDAGGPEVFLKAVAGRFDPTKDKCLRAFLQRWPEGRPEDPHTSKRPIYSIKDKVSGSALRHAFNIGTIEGIVPHGMEAYEPDFHGDDMDAFRSAYALGYSHEDYSEPTTAKQFMDALRVGYIRERHDAMGGPVTYLKAISAGFRPGLDGSPKVFLKQHTNGKLPPRQRQILPYNPSRISRANGGGRLATPSKCWIKEGLFKHSNSALHCAVWARV